MKVVAQASRLVPYWLTVVVAYWCIGFEFAWNSTIAYDKINSGMIAPVRNETMAQDQIATYLFISFGSVALSHTPTSFILVLLHPMKALRRDHSCHCKRVEFCAGLFPCATSVGSSCVLSAPIQHCPNVQNVELDHKSYCKDPQVPVSLGLCGRRTPDSQEESVSQGRG